MLGFILMLVALLWLVFAKEIWMFYLFAGAFGFAAGCWVAALPLIGDLFGMMSHGVFVGFSYFSFNIGAMIGPVLAGYIFDATGSYQPAWIATAASGIMSVMMTLLIRQAGTPVRVNDRKRSP